MYFPDASEETEGPKKKRKIGEITNNFGHTRRCQLSKNISNVVFESDDDDTHDESLGNISDNGKVECAPTTSSQTDCVNFGDKDDAPYQSEGEQELSEDSPGQPEDASGQSEDAPSQSEDAPSQSEDASSQSEGVPRQYEDALDLGRDQEEEADILFPGMFVDELDDAILIGDQGENDSDQEEREDEEEEEEQEEEEEGVNGEGFRGNFNLGDQGDQPLYDGAPLSLAESLFAVLTLSVVHNLTGSCLADVLSLIFFHCKKPTLFIKTLFKLSKFFQNLKTPIIRHSYCSDCLEYLESEATPCHCEHRKTTSYFIEIPIAQQLISLFARKGFYGDLQHRFTRKSEMGKISDVYDGRVYKKLFKPGGFLFEKNNLSFSWYSDGIPIFKSKKYNLGPMYLVINELPYRKRIMQQNIIIAGLRFDSKDPIVNLFLKPIHSELETLAREGVNVRKYDHPNDICVKAVGLFGTADTPARSDFLRHVRFNGDYGCTVCYAKGYTITGVDHGNTHVYPFEGVEKKRPKNGTDAHAEMALQTGKPVFGVKGPTLLLKIMPNVISGMIIDVMHCVFLGVIRKLLVLWFDPKYRHGNFSLYAYLNVIDECLAKIKPSSHVQRVPRSIEEHLSFLKASEYKNLFFYYLIQVIHDIMNPTYFDHVLKLVTGITMLCTEFVCEDNVFIAEDLLLPFVSQFQALYDARFLSINLHLLRHLPEVVLNSGPLWVLSCFPFEDLNGKIVKSIHGTTHVGLQVYGSVAHSIMLPYLVSQLPDDSESKLFSQRLLQCEQRQALTEIAEKTYVVGKITQCGPIVPRQLQLALNNELINYEKVSVFHRLKHGRQLFSSSTYSKAESRLNSYVLFENEQKRIGNVIIFVRVCHCRNPECENNCTSEHYVLLEEGIIEPCFSASSSLIIGANDNMHNLPHMFKFISRDELELVPISNLSCACFVVDVDDTTYVAEPVNLLETE